LFEIKPLSICNLEEVIGLYKKMIKENIGDERKADTIDFEDRSLRNMLQYSFDIENDLFYVAYSRNIPIGFIDSTRVCLDGKDDEWYIKSVYLETEFRAKNYFQQLVMKVEKEARQKSIHTIFSNSLIDDNEADDLWESLGYNFEGKRRVKVYL